MVGSEPRLDEQAGPGTAATWIALARDGAVAFVSDPSVRKWLGARLWEREDCPEALRRAARDLETRRAGNVDVFVDGVTYRISMADVVALHRARVDLVPLLRGAVEPLVSQAKAMDVTITVDSEPDLPSVSADPEKIAWAVTTLVGNALRYVPRGTRRMPGGSVRVHARSDAARSEVVISVEDDGPGIPDDKCKALFCRSGGMHGTGLGLLLIRDVVVAHGGDVEVRSSCERLASGVTVLLRLPAA